MKFAKQSKFLLNAIAMGAVFLSANASAQLMSSNIPVEPHYLNDTYFSFDGQVIDEWVGGAVRLVPVIGPVTIFSTVFLSGGPGSDTFLVTPGLGSIFSPTQTAELRALYSHTFPLYNAAVNDYVASNNGSYLYNGALNSQFQNMVALGAAINDVMFEIEYETDASTGLDMAAGSFQLTRQQATYSVPLDMFYDKAVTWAGNIQSGAWTDIGGVDYHYADALVGPLGGNEHWLALTPAVPEPGTWALMLGGFGAIGFMARRRSQLAALI